MSTEDGPAAELDEDALAALHRYLDACDARDIAQEAYDKARSDLLSFLAVRDVTVGTVEGRPAIAVSRYDRETVDTARLKVEEPFMYQRFVRLTKVETLRLRGSRSRLR